MLISYLNSEVQIHHVNQLGLHVIEGYKLLGIFVFMDKLTDD